MYFNILFGDEMRSRPSRRRGVPVLVGQIPLEGLDFVVDLANQRLIGNPAHGGEHIIELY